MNLKTLKNAVALAMSNSEPADFPDYRSIYDELCQLECHLVESRGETSLIDDLCHIVSDYSLFTLLDECIYDDVGILLRTCGDIRQRTIVETINNRHFGLYELQPSLIVDAATTIADLWHDNDGIFELSAVPIHNKDGSFSKVGDGILWKVFHDRFATPAGFDSWCEKFGIDAFEKAHLKNVLYMEDNNEQN